MTLSALSSDCVSGIRSATAVMLLSTMAPSHSETPTASTMYDAEAVPANIRRGAAVKTAATHDLNEYLCCLEKFSEAKVESALIACGIVKPQIPKRSVYPDSESRGRAHIASKAGILAFSPCTSDIVETHK